METVDLALNQLDAPSSIGKKESLRNGSVACPFAPGTGTVRLNFPPITKQIGTSGIVLDALHGLLKLPGLAVGGEHFEVE